MTLQFINATQAIPSANIGDMKALEVLMLRTALIAAIAATPALADPEDYGHMMGWGYGNGLGMIFGPVLWLLVLGLIVVGVIWFVRRLDHQSGHKATSNAMAELDLRFARGEIDADEYASRKKPLMS